MVAEYVILRVQHFTSLRRSSANWFRRSDNTDVITLEKMANSIFIQHDPANDWQLLVTAFIEHCRASHAILDPTVAKGSFEYITPNGRAFLQLSVPDKQWSQMYPAFKDWAGLNSHHSAWIEHGRIWISDGTSHHLRDCQRIETDGKLN